MKTLDAGFILGTLAFAFYLPIIVTSHQALTIPAKLQLARGRVIVNTTPCTVTCGLGYKEESTCEVGPDGVRRKCETHHTECLTNWICGMVHFTVPIGKEFELTCLSEDILLYGQEAFRFTWMLARGIISTDDELFKPFRRSIHSMVLNPVREHDSGTYRCDVQLLKNLRFVKRVYFALRVIPADLVNLNFDQSLTEAQKLIDKGMDLDLDKHTHLQRSLWNKKVWLALGIGITGGVIVGVLVSIAVHYLLKTSKRKGKTEM
ncbi:transmembrane protein 81 [Trichosurus vulpecula]|uniref:transmembrane protein 81 n=1 Tax=Trichosurus vulpecula TaxID=9337 RepID=UPI00186B25CE|nr:transmembrane protein 81 [Trichosurus vulpecula]